MQVCSSLELENQGQASCPADIGIGGFLSRCHRAVTPAIVFRVDTQETVESVQGNQLYLEWIGILGYFGIVSRPLEFLSSFKLRPPPLEVQQECRNSFPNETGKWTLISK